MPLFSDGFEATGACAAASTGGDRQVAAPQLIATLSNRFREAWLGSPAVADLDGDGVMEILAPRQNLMLGWHLDNQVVFEASVSGRIWASPLVADFVPGSAGLEVAAASREQILLWNSAGALLPGFPVTWRDEIRSLAGGDIDGDGDLELVAVTTSRLSQNGQRDIVFAVHHDGTTVTGFPPNTTGAAGCDAACFVTGGFDQNIGLGNVDGDAELEIFAPHDNAYLSLHDGDGRAFDSSPIFSTPTKVLGVRFLHNLSEAMQGFANNEATALQAHFTNSAPTFADVDGDGLNELVVLASVQNAAQTNRELGVALWAVNPDGTRPGSWTTPFHVPEYLAGLVDFPGTNVVAATNQVSVAELDASRPGPEFVFAGFDGRIHAVDSAANLLWSTRYTTDSRVLTGGVVIADLSSDGQPEVVFATYSPDNNKGALFVLDAGGQVAHTIALPDRGAMPVPTIAQANTTEALEIVVSLKDAVDRERQVLVYEVPGSADNCLAWPTGRGNLLRNGSVN
ncbi:MAG: VCBS repeat-containing protein [Pseudomonadota bacterium]